MPTGLFLYVMTPLSSRTFHSHVFPGVGVSSLGVRFLGTVMDELQVPKFESYQFIVVLTVPLLLASNVDSVYRRTFRTSSMPRIIRA